MSRLSYTPMKALTIRQPWAWAIAEGHKTIENRTWNTNHRGLFYIHAAQALASKQDIKRCAYLLERFCGVILPRQETWVRGALIATANLFDCRLDHYKHVVFAEIGCYHFALDDIKKIRPVRMKGALGFWNVSTDPVGETGRGCDE
jgi:ASCH domain